MGTRVLACEFEQCESVLASLYLALLLKNAIDTANKVVGAACSNGKRMHVYVLKYCARVCIKLTSLYLGTLALPLLSKAINTTNEVVGAAFSRIFSMMLLSARSSSSSAATLGSIKRAMISSTIGCKSQKKYTCT